MPHGFDTRTADLDIAVHGDAADDPGFTGGAARVRDAVPVQGDGPFTVEAELLYQPVGLRWAQKRKPYSSPFEARRFSAYCDGMARGATARLASFTR